MQSFLTRQKRKSSPEPVKNEGDGDEPTEIKLAILSSLHPQLDQEVLLDVLLAHEGSVSEASASLQTTRALKKGNGGVGYQQSLRSFTTCHGKSSPANKKLKAKKGSTLHLYDPADVAEHTPCTIIHNFLPAEV